jgi:hypothetical protein
MTFGPARTLTKLLTPDMEILLIALAIAGALFGLSMLLHAILGLVRRSEVGR